MIGPRSCQKLKPLLYSRFNHHTPLVKTEKLMSKYSKPKVLVTRSDYPPEGIELLKEKCDVDIWSVENGIMSNEVLKKRIQGKEGLFCCLTDKINEGVLNAAGKSLKVVSTMSVGFDHIDIKTAKNLGIKLGYTPNVLTEATAELTVALLLATSRRLIEANRAVISGEWKTWSPLWLCGPGLEGSTVGIFGMGRIGLSVAKKLIPFGVKQILYTNRTISKEGDKLGAKSVDFDCLLKESDFVIVNTVYSPETHEIFNAEKFDSMKKTAIIINTSRGGVIDQCALVEALQCKKIAGAGLDVMMPEPLPADHPLTKLDNVVLLPHIGSASHQSRRDMSELTARNIISALEGKPMPAELVI